ncbi:GntR family transcriptional regulator [Actinocatenispora rupis]|uniref:GntR family transcriptional regulator n=1 Tax=Actinocatenispora rupis TaxID=519421 RepID=A0A8J3J204_9ACTN|nr:GntR family transcriptional regulator [Actinocatenispora rupis]GID13080.1 GntR family transcriptional regulator [Actinocatenispora rupis]
MESERNDRISGEGAYEDRRVPSRRIADELRERIRRGDYPPGFKLPSERNLAADFSTARNTATAALSILQKEGLVDRKHGSGWYVRTHRPLLRLGSNRYSHALREQTGLSPFRAEVQKQGRTARVDCTSIAPSRPPEVVADRLGVDPDSESVIRRENWYYADDEPVQAGVTYIPLEVAGDSVLATSANMGKGSLYARFKDRGYDLTRVREEICARMPTPEEAERLQMSGGVPVLVVLHTGIDQNNKPFEVTEFVMRADTNALDYNMPIED